MHLTKLYYQQQYNSAFGGNTLYNNTTGNFNTCIGHSSGFANTTGSCMTGVGQQALAKNTIGNYNTAVGFLSSVENTTGSANTSVGGFSLCNNSIGSYNTAIGFFSSQTNTIGNNNSSTGYQALDKNITGNNNSAFGYWALSNNTTGSSNVCLGSAAGQSMVTTVGSSCIGANSDTSFSYSTSIGSNSVCTAEHQIMLGTVNETVVIPKDITFNGSINEIIKTTLSYFKNVTSDIQQQISSLSSNIISNIGYITQTLTDTSSSTQFGNQAYNKTSTGFNNTAFGSRNLNKNTTGNHNTSVGFISMSDNTTGSANTSIGYNSLGKNTTGSSNTCIGLGSLMNNTTGSNNIAIGQYSGLSMVSTTGSTCIGTTSDCAYSYSTALGYNSTCTANHQIMLGTVQETVVVPNDITFAGSINEVPRTKLSYIKNVSSDVQNQINTINNANPSGSVIQYAGSSASLSGYLKCDGNLYSISSYPNLYNAIGTMYGGDSNLGYFNVPNFQGIFLRGAGSQTVNLNVIAGNGGAIQKTYNSPALGQIFPDETAQSTINSYVNNITTSVRSFVTSVNDPLIGTQKSNAVSSMQFTTSNETINIGNTETFPVHTSIQYFIKY